MKSALRSVSVSIEVRNSRFLAETFPVSSQDEVKKIIKAQKDRYPDARHVVHAFIIGDTGEIHGCSDDGEPSGTAGRPVLEILKGEDVTGLLLTITRWFGGTLLGTGGLVHAYSEAARAALSASEFVELIRLRDFSLELSYADHEKARRAFPRYSVLVIREEFETSVVIEGSLPDGNVSAFQNDISEITCGRSIVTVRQESRMGPRT